MDMVEEYDRETGEIVRTLRVVPYSIPYDISVTGKYDIYLSLNGNLVNTGKFININK